MATLNNQPLRPGDQVFHLSWGEIVRVHEVQEASFTVISTTRGGSPQRIMNEGKAATGRTVVFWRDPVIVTPDQNDLAFDLLPALYATLRERI